MLLFQGDSNSENSSPKDYVFQEGAEDSLVDKKQVVIKARRSASSVLGWDLPVSCLKFSLVQGKGKFGDIFVGRMDDRSVRVKVMRPDCKQDAKDAFDRELEMLR